MNLLKPFLGNYPILFPTLKSLTLTFPKRLGRYEYGALKIEMNRQTPDWQNEEKLVERFRYQATKAGILGAHNCLLPGKQDSHGRAFDITAQNEPPIPLTLLRFALWHTQPVESDQFNFVQVHLEVKQGNSPRALADLTTWAITQVDKLGGVAGLPLAAKTSFSEGLATITIAPC